MASYLTSNQSSQVADSFRLGFTTGERANEARRSDDAITQRAVAQQKAIEDRVIAVEKMQIDAKAQESKLKAERAINENAREFTDNSIKENINALRNIASGGLKAKNIILNRPDAYDIPKSVQKIEQNSGIAQQILGMAMAATSSVKPGEAFDATPFFNEMSKLNFEPVVSEEYLKGQEAKTKKTEAETTKAEAGTGLTIAQTGLTNAKAANEADPYGATLAKERAKGAVKLEIDKIKPPKEAKGASVVKHLGFINAMKNYQSLSDKYESSYNALPDETKVKAAAEGKRPLQDLERARNQAYQNTIGYSEDLANDVLSGGFGPDKAMSFRKLTDMGLRPFEVDDVRKVRDYFSKVYQDASANGAQDVATKANEYATFFTGIPLK